MASCGQRAQRAMPLQPLSQMKHHVKIKANHFNEVALRTSFQWHQRLLYTMRHTRRPTEADICTWERALQRSVGGSRAARRGEKRRDGGSAFHRRGNCMSRVRKFTTISPFDMCISTMLGGSRVKSE